MAQQLIVDDKADFWVNTAEFPFVDPTTGVRFEPGLHIKVKSSDWMKGQSTIQKVETEKPAKADK